MKITCKCTKYVEISACGYIEQHREPESSAICGESGTYVGNEPQIQNAMPKAQKLTPEEWNQLVADNYYIPDSPPCGICGCSPCDCPIFDNEGNEI